MSVAESAVFGTTYANIYDVLYHDKDYQTECDLLERYFRQHATQPVKHILDIGCGTGNHALMLAERGYNIAGVDLSHDMIVQARRKAMTKSLSGSVAWHQGDARTVRLNETFDAVVMLFAVLGYQYTNADVEQALATVKHHLKPGGLFIFDVWYGPAVLAQRPGDRVRILRPTATTEVIRWAHSDLNTYQQTCTVNYRVITLENGTKVADAHESHTMRYFFPQELAAWLKFYGLELLSLQAFPDITKPVTEESWNAIGVARLCP